MFAPLTGDILDSIAANFGIVRSPGEDDASLRRRAITMARYQPAPPLVTMRLWLLLARLGIKSVPRDVFPAGVQV